jgi:hypothetical protein
MKTDLQIMPGISFIHLKHFGNASECFSSIGQARSHKSEIYIVQNYNDLSL